MRKTYIKPSLKNYRMTTPQLLEGSNKVPIVSGDPDEWGARGEGGWLDDDDEE